MSYQAPTVPLSEVAFPQFQFFSGLLCQHMLLRSSSDPPVELLGGKSGGSCNRVEALEWPVWPLSSSRSVGRELVK